MKIRMHAIQSLFPQDYSMKYKDYLSPVSLNQSASFNNFFHLFICKEKKDMNQTKLKSREPR